MSRDTRVAVVGAGLGGIAMAVRLRRAGLHSFTVFEQSDGPGGVWWQNTYPGCEVDVPSQAYSYSYVPYAWSGTHARQPELQTYAEHVIDRFDLRPHFRFGTGVAEARWDDDAATWTVRTTDGAEHEFDVLVTSVGMLSHPRLPVWPGLENFAGPVFHTARFDHRAQLAGKRVALIGTGSSACQLGPAIAHDVAQLDVYQREPGHVLPKKVRPFDEPTRRRLLRNPLYRRVQRLKAFRWIVSTNDALMTTSRNHERVEAVFHRYLTKTVRDPETREALRPAYTYGCKRPIFASGWYPMFNRENVMLVPRAVTEVTHDGVVDDTGTKRPADVLVLSTGFQPTNYLGTLRVSGASGRDLHETWDDEPWAFLGLTVPGFPNLFMLYGPNTNGGGSIITQLEIQAAAVARTVRRLRPGRAFDTREAPARRIDRWIQRQIAARMDSQAAGCHNYYHSATGKNVTQWPLSHTAYRLAVRLLLRPGLRRVTRPHASPIATGGAHAAR